MVFELSTKMYLLNSIAAEETPRKLSALIDRTLGKKEEYLLFHRQNAYKNYSLDGFFPIEKGGIYKEGKIYIFRIRTVDKDLAEYLEKSLFTAYTNDMKVLTVATRVIPKKHIEKIYTLTPLVIKNDYGYWRSNMSLEEYEERIGINLIKNYKQFYNCKLDEDFELFTSIEFNNCKPIAVPMKNNISLLADKITLHISENSKAQALAYFALGVGLGENGPRGFGFCGYKYL
ncbi:MAG TPA: CRISPR-associated endoribonuclease Cas6 [Clostridiales bacterium]|nr:CRISPR-associated endoribonuclease Cas6 [Clostridiales bacterium]